MPGPVQALAVDEEGRRPVGPGPPAGGDVGENSLSKAPLAQGRLGVLCIKAEPPHNGEQVLLGEVRAPGEQEGMRLPELAARRREFRKLGREIRSGMELSVGKVAPDQAKTVKAIEERLHRSPCLKAIRTAEVPVLDQHQLRLVRAGDVVFVTDGRRHA